MAIKLFLVASVVFLALDMLWLGLIAKKFYRDQIGFLLRKKPNKLAATIFYTLFIVGLLVFVVYPSDSITEAAVLGGFFGLVTYGTYDLTNLSVVHKWPLPLTIVDMGWGTVLAAATAVITKAIS